jgi:hypothetical protein
MSLFSTYSNFGNGAEEFHPHKTLSTPMKLLSSLSSLIWCHISIINAYETPLRLALLTPVPVAVFRAISCAHAGPASPRTSPTSRRGLTDGGCPSDAGRRRRHRGKAAKSEKGDATPDLFLKYPDAILATYV